MPRDSCFVAPPFRSRMVSGRRVALISGMQTGIVNQALGLKPSGVQLVLRNLEYPHPPVRAPNTAIPLSHLLYCGCLIILIHFPVCGFYSDLSRNSDPLWLPSVTKEFADVLPPEAGLRDLGFRLISFVYLNPKPRFISESFETTIKIMDSKESQFATRVWGLGLEF